MGMRKAKQNFQLAINSIRLDPQSERQYFYEGVLELMKGIEEHFSDLERKIQHLESVARGH